MPEQRNESSAAQDRLCGRCGHYKSGHGEDGCDTEVRADRSRPMSDAATKLGEGSGVGPMPSPGSSAAKLCLARWEAGRSYPCALPKGHAGRHEHPMDPVPEDHMLAVSA